ncbi:glycosyltransferase family 2 protein [Desulfosarcina ovata]|uniref:Glycosyl transferase n=1 Tax=Desulfosarcina ovata subsp. ovata TaxID=2752305 RepID=A0A5K8AFR4_9BACT|nr:glycosyltransferase [Desulfosarcina ovata]BBO91457.1 glycosyl transferase [Desulfosarcina ovata subsp. ovata]
MNNGKSPLVSVVLPTYNRAWTVRSAIDSVLNQDYTALELIVVDDGSTDGTADLLADYGTQIQVIRQSNQGVSAARNAGIQAAEGNLIALLDSDDAWLPGKVAAQVDFFSRHPDALICQTEELWIRNGARVNPGKRHRKEGGMIFERSLELCLVSPSAVMLHRSLLDEVGGFDPDLPACEDYDLWLRIAWKYPIHLIERPLIVKHGGHADQLSRMPELDKYRIRSITRLLQCGCLSEDQQTAAIAMLKNKCAIYAQGCRKRGRIAEAGEYEKLTEKF